jgi:hypothetical protein
MTGEIDWREARKRYKVQRLYKDWPGHRRTILTGLTLQQAQTHCSDPETSSSTCVSATGKRRTRQMGPWFDSYTEE